MNNIFTGRSCSERSVAKVEVVHNPENNVFGIFVTDNSRDVSLVTLDADTILRMAEAILKEAGAHE